MIIPPRDECSSRQWLAASTLTVFRCRGSSRKLAIDECTYLETQLPVVEATMGLPLQLSVFNLKKQMPTTDTEEKIKSAERLVSIRTNTINDQKLPKQSVDEAFEYLRLHADVLGEAAIDKGRLLRKIDRRIMPIMYLIYLFQFLDKFLLNYAIIMGLPEDLELQGQQLNTVASALWWTYLAFSPVVGVLLNKVPIGKWLGGNMLLWGIVISCTAAVKTYPQLIGIRVLMGLFDAGIPPSLMLISSQYYRKDEQAARFAIWFSSVGMGIILGGLISFGFQNVRSSILASWRKFVVRTSGWWY